ncbi:type 2 periplasmic-binding domain-containing protein [Skeletonema marinoi]|jgi:hypothetical protein|uniref:Type 2 periplasmic-binding domain-containing protein n=1 Tax=Skeletonema marinoi TaxID=267567 RepID=A0AAD9D6P3_9STRA|nr:type 2 periplasmic-binding domain-containing protein [Skeletonema marinoi]
MRIKAALLSVSWFAHAASSSSVGDDITLHAGIMSLPPYAVLTNKTWSGYMFDLANLLMDNAETNHNVSLNIIMNASDPYYMLNVSPSNYSYNGALKLLSPECPFDDCLDMIFADFYDTPERRELVSFTPPYQISYNTYFKRKNNTINTVKEVNENGGSGCLIAGTATYTAVSPYFDTVLDCEDAYDCYDKLMLDKCDLFAGDVLIGKYQIKESYPDDLTYTGEVINKLAYKLALPMKKSLPQSTLQLMNDLMNEATTSGELGNIEKKYFGTSSDIAALEEMYFGGKDDVITNEEDDSGTDTSISATEATDESDSSTVSTRKSFTLVMGVLLLFFS